MLPLLGNSFGLFMEQDAYNAALKAYIQALRDLERVSKSDDVRFQAAFQRLEEARRAFDEARAANDTPWQDT